MIRVALYARYSSENQRDASIEDQLRQCRERAAHEGWAVVDSYSDRAISGASLVRAGIQELPADAQTGRFGVVLSETMDRISRGGRGGRLQTPALRRRLPRHLVRGRDQRASYWPQRHHGPRQRPRVDTAIRGNAAAGTGIPNNELYAGILTWNQRASASLRVTGTAFATG